MKNDINAAGESEELANEYETRAVGKPPGEGCHTHVPMALTGLMVVSGMARLPPADHMVMGAHIVAKARCPLLLALTDFSKKVGKCGLSSHNRPGPTQARSK